MDHVNLRAAFGACRDFDCDISEVKGLQSVQIGNIILQMAPVDYYNANIALNSVPMGWFNTITGLAV